MGVYQVETPRVNGPNFYGRNNFMCRFDSRGVGFADAASLGDISLSCHPVVLP